MGWRRRVRRQRAMVLRGDVEGAFADRQAQLRSQFVSAARRQSRWARRRNRRRAVWAWFVRGHR